MLKIRSYQKKDEAAVRAICLGGTEGMMREALAVCFCNYYIEREPELCFVAADEADHAAGYVLCAADYHKWKNAFEKDYLEGALNPMTAAMGKGTILAMQAYCEEYPAHLHIDLKPEAQGQGTGRRLIEALCAALRDRGIKGLMLNVAADNKGAQRFYEKCGFTLLGRTEMEWAYGKRL